MRRAAATVGWGLAAFEYPKRPPSQEPESQRDGGDRVPKRAYYTGDGRASELALWVRESGARTAAVGAVGTDDAAIDRIVVLTRPLDKAGAYAIQDERITLIDRTEGSFSNVVGLPMELLQRELRGLLAA